MFGRAHQIERLVLASADYLHRHEAISDKLIQQFFWHMDCVKMNVFTH